ncbi:hypothetical protein AXA44_10870 [Rhodococcus sp. SC4]|nr:hypothetical protein AXA44_10870 [Rhodococcus sp. SC4]
MRWSTRWRGRSPTGAGGVHLPGDDGDHRLVEQDRSAIDVTERDEGAARLMQADVHQIGIRELGADRGGAAGQVE